MSICKLCLEEKQLIKKSHIIPDFMYQDLYDENHQIRMFSPLKRVEGDKKIKTPSSGEYEGGLLCEACDRGIIGHQYEDYASKILSGKGLCEKMIPTASGYVNEKGIPFSIVSNIDYKKFKLFCLSILWRASISKRPFFSAVDLGVHEEKIRKMIYFGDPGEKEKYPFSIYEFLCQSKRLHELIAQPKKVRDKDGLTSYVFIVSGLIIRFYIFGENHKVQSKIIEATINESNQMYVTYLNDDQGMDYILRYCNVKKRKGKK